MISKVNIKVFIVLLLTAFLSCKKTSSANDDTGRSNPAADTVISQSLFTKYIQNPVFNIGNNYPAWRSIHAANVSILAPLETRDGKWRLFMRGSGNNSDGYHDNIGTFEQPATTFNPVGQWSELNGNPNLPHGTTGTYDGQNVLDAAALPGSSNVVILYYMGRNAENRSSLCIATSNDGGITFSKYYHNPLKQDVGPNDAVFNNNKYYLFYGDGKWNGNGFDEPLQIWLSISDSATAMSQTPVYALKVGSYGSFDSYSVNGAKIFKVTGDNRWFMLYQCSTKNFDYPERFHCAYSTDLINWTKVKNTIPLLTRGKQGEFDQGAIWTGSVIEYNSTLYIYYEGWGSFNNDLAKRDTPYYSGGNSRVGIASCSVTDFLNWINK